MDGSEHLRQMVTDGEGGVKSSEQLVQMVWLEGKVSRPVKR